MRRSVILGAAVMASIGLALMSTALHARKSSLIGVLHDGTLAPMLEKALPAVVSIRVKGFQFVEQNPLFNHPQYSQMVSGPARQAEQREFQSSGSGVILDAKRGLVITNYHVIEKAKEIKVHFQDGREFVGKLLGQDPATDVAVIQIEAHDLAGIAIGDSSKVRIGDLVVALGNPFGLEATATLGMVSSLRRSTVGYRELESYIQHDAAVNSGNSGGALINVRGELIGINTAIISPSGGNIGLGFAIPIKMAVLITEQLVKYGRVRRGWAGAKVADLTFEKIKALDLSVYKGAMITGIQKGSPAEVAGAKIDDIVISVILPGGRTLAVSSAAEMRAGEAIAEVGTAIVVKVMRDGAVLDLPMTIEDLPRERETKEVPREIVRLAGLVVGSLEADSPLFGEVRGVEVLDVKAGTIAQLAGLLSGDIVTQVEQDRVRGIEDFLKAIKDKNAKFEMRILRNNVPITVRFPL